MPTDPTRKALQAAVDAIHEATVGDPLTAPEAATAAIAAYLRALGRDIEADRVQRAAEREGR